MAIGTPSVRPRSVSLSLALHAAAIVGALLTSALGSESLPTPAVVAASRDGVVVDVASLRVVPPPALARRSRPRLPSLRHRPAIASSPTSAESVAPLAARTIQEASDPVDGPLAGTDGACTEGCVVGPADPGPGDALGDGSGGERVVSIVAGGVIRAPRKVRDTPPTYPDLAIRGHVEGRVEIDCRIDATGRVVDATVLRGHPLLSPAALAAVRQWVYQPTLLNGVPVSVVMTVTVHFRLRHS